MRRSVGIFAAHPMVAAIMFFESYCGSLLSLSALTFRISRRSVSAPQDDSMWLPSICEKESRT
jgi:cytochrome bd-type quinol oxidase subunit 2